MGIDFFKGLQLGPVDFRKKKDRVGYFVRKLLNLCSSMLEFENLPETIPERDFKRLLQVHGYALGPDPRKIPDGRPYMFFGGLGGPPDVYYDPTIATIANPALNWSAQLDIGTECVLIRHDEWQEGLLPIIRPYATLAAETELSMYIALINSRIPVLVSANDSRTFESAKDFLKAMEGGDLALIFETKLQDAIRTSPYSQASARTFTDLIEISQYLKATLYNDLGINANYNMKRESLSMTESQMNDDALLPYIDGVIHSIQTGLDRYNELYGFDIKVKKGSAWAYREIEEQEQHDEDAELMFPESAREEASEDAKE